MNPRRYERAAAIRRPVMLPALAWLAPTFACAQAGEHALSVQAATPSIAAEIPVRRAAAEAASGMEGWAIVVVLVLSGLLALWVVRKQMSTTSAGRGTAKAQPGARRTAVVRLDAKHALHEIHWRDEALLVACGEGGVQLVARTPLAPSPEATT